MAMTREQFQERITAIGTCENEADRREMLTALSEEGSTIFDDLAAASTARDNALADNEKLRDANMKLFLRVGDHKDPEPPPGTKNTPKLKFEDLFDEKGGLK